MALTHENSAFDSQEDVVLAVLEERRRQDKKWGEQNHHPLYWLGILMEEVGEAAKAAIEHHVGHWGDYQKELIHVAAVAIAAIESAERNRISYGDR